MTEERPTSLRRPPRPAADENIDPIDPRPATTEPAAPKATAAAESAIAPTESPRPSAGPPAPPALRETTVQLSVKVAPDVVQLIDGAIAAARARGERLTQRAAIEQAIRHLWG